MPNELEMSLQRLLERARGLVSAALDAATVFGGRWKTIAVRLERPRSPPKAGKLQMQSDLDALTGKLDLSLWTARCLSRQVCSSQMDVRELLARLQTGHTETKHRAVEGLHDALREDEKSVMSALGRGNVAALVQPLMATAPKIREKVDTVHPAGRVRPSSVHVTQDCPRRLLIEICQTGDSISQSATAGTLKNLSAVPEVRQALAEEGIVRVMISLLDRGGFLPSLRRAVVSEGALPSLLAYLDGPLPQESAVGAVSPDTLVSLGVLPQLAHQAGAGGICRISSSPEMKRRVADHGCMPLLVRLLEAKSNGAREVAAATLMSCPANARSVKKDDKSVPNLVHLLDPSPGDTVKKYAISGAIGYLNKLSEMDVAGANKHRVSEEAHVCRLVITKAGN
ncbi:hypothetical protein CFC21_038060 [Triticum aestivum]|uniref:Uncharacterized protein n=2 Tax=Triticum aestivum TaxID=4565 RepID=A0A9R1FC12_WHEAT|nr:hypothetical protein CFC21_038060 [Triticum aestivum]